MIAENSLAFPKLSTNVTVQVIVYDVGVQRPQFTSSEYQAEVAESVAVGTSVIRINVTNNEQVFELCCTLLERTVWTRSSQSLKPSGLHLPSQFPGISQDDNRGIPGQPLSNISVLKRLD